MNSSASSSVRPLLLKAGLPMAISVAGFICAKFMIRRNVTPEAALENKVSCNKIATDSSDFEEEIISSTTHFMDSMGSDNQELDYEQEILSLRHQVEELQKKELEMKMQLVRYHDLKEEESVLIELRNMMLLEKAYVELLDKEILAMEAESKRLDNLVVQYLSVLDQLQHWKSDTASLQAKVKKLLRISKQKSWIIREKNLKIKAVQADLFTSCTTINQLENQVKEQQCVINRMQEQTNELQNKLEQSALSISKNEDHYERRSATIEDYKQILNEYEQLRKDRADEVKELIYLRWSNACLRHELMRNHGDADAEQEEKNIVEFEGCVEQVEEACFNGGNGDALSKRKKLLQKLKRWVDGSEKEKHEINCFRNRRHSVAYETENETEEHQLTVLARKSCSSA